MLQASHEAPRAEARPAARTMPLKLAQLLAVLITSVGLVALTALLNLLVFSAS